MDNFDYVMKYLDPLLDRYISTGKQSLSEEERELLAVWCLDSEVNNGGFDQFYWNSTGDLATEAVEGLTTIGADERAGIVEAANSEFPNGKPNEDREERQKQLDIIQSSTKAKLNSLNDEYYSCREGVIDLFASFLQASNEK